MMHIAVVDDNPIFVSRISSLISSAFATLGIPCKIYTFCRAFDLFNILDITPISLIFLDIDMPDINGIQAGEYLFKKGLNREIVYVSGYDSYVFDALKVYPFDFVRKSYMKTEISETIEHFIGIYKIDNSFVEVKSSYHTYRILSKDILYIEKSGRKTQIIRNNDEPLNTWSNINTFENRYHQNGFIRISSNAIINIKYLEDVNKNFVILCNDITLPISRDRFPAITAEFLNYKRK